MENQSANTNLKRVPHINILSRTEREQTSSILYLTTEDREGTEEGIYTSVL